MVNTMKTEENCLTCGKHKYNKDLQDFCSITKEHVKFPFPQVCEDYIKDEQKDLYQNMILSEN